MRAQRAARVRRRRARARRRARRRHRHRSAAARGRRRLDQPDGRHRVGCCSASGSATPCCVTSRRTSARSPCPALPLDPAPFTVVEYFPDPERSGFHDPRHHAVSLAYVVPVDGDCKPTQEALDLAWFTPAEAVSRRGARADDRRPRPPDPPRPRPRRLPPVAPRPSVGTGGITRGGPPGAYARSRCPRATRSTARRVRLRTALVDHKMVRFEAPRLVGRRAPGGADDRAGREPRQAPRDRVGRRRHPPHPHAHERVVARLSLGGAVAAPAPRDARRHRDRHVGGGVLQRADRRDVPQSRTSPPPGTRAARARPVPRRRRPRPLRRAAALLRRSARLDQPRCCSTSACSAGSATCTAARCCGPAS